MSPRLGPQRVITPDEREAGVRLLVVEAAFANTTAALTTGVILTSFALYLGAGNFVIGLLAALPFLAQLAQVPAIGLIERWRARKAISVWSSVAGRAMLGVMAGLPFAGGLALSGLVLATLVLCVMAAIGGCAWNAWMRDFAPPERMGRVFAARSVWATATTVIASIAAAALLRLTPLESPVRAWAFCALYLIGCLAGLVSALIVARIPEPAIPAEQAGGRDLRGLLAQPFRDRNFVRLLAFLGSWQFAVNVATPFFTVYLVRQLGYRMDTVMALSVASQLANAVALGNWGALTDRFSNKSVLMVAAPVYILAIVGMVGAGQFLGQGRFAWLLVLHLAMGASVAGVTLATANISLKLSPRGESAAYLAAGGIVSAAAAGTAPLLGGLFADWFAARHIEVIVRWVNPSGVLAFQPLTLGNWEFYFLLSGLLGLWALHRLSAVREEGEVGRDEVVRHVLAQARSSVHNFSSVTGLKALTELPGTLLREARVRRRWLRINRLRSGSR